MLLHVTVGRAERVEHRVVFNLPYIFKHDFMELAIHHVITYTASLLVGLHLAYWVPVGVLPRLVLLWTDWQAVCEVRLIGVIGDAADHGHG